MRRRRWIAPGSGGAAFLLVFLAVLASPADSGRFVKGGYDVVPATARALVPDTVEASLGATIDASVRVLALGDPDKLIRADLRLEGATVPVAWIPNRQFLLEWTDLGHDSIRYDVTVASAGAEPDLASPQVSSPDPFAQVTVPGDGSFDVWVVPRTDETGRATRFGPFRVDATAPAAPILAERADPPGYRFDVQWSKVDDLSGVASYEVERRRLQGTDVGPWENVANPTATLHREDQIGNGVYQYRVRAVNGAGLASAPSNTIEVLVKAPMQNPGPGTLDYGIHANYTGFLHLWDLTDPDAYVQVDQVPADVRSAYLGAEPGIETDNETLRGIVVGVVGPERGTLRIAESLFEYLFDAVDYDEAKPSDPDARLQSAGETLDRGAGICGDLAVLYTTLLRIAGVPARPVHGYLDNARSGIGGFHMWVEVYVGPAGSPHAWMPVDVSGVDGSYSIEALFAYFGLFNPDYLALGTELAFDRYDDDQWNTWARFRYLTSGPSNAPKIRDDANVVEYESEVGRLYFNTATRATRYEPCRVQPALTLDDPCPDDPAPPGFGQYYVVKGVSKKRIDFGASLEANMPSCLRVELRYPHTDEHGAVGPEQSSIYNVYEGTSSANVQVGAPDAEGWVTFLDGTNAASCNQL